VLLNINLTVVLVSKTILVVIFPTLHAMIRHIKNSLHIGNEQRNKILYLFPSDCFSYGILNKLIGEPLCCNTAELKTLLSSLW